MKFLQTDQGFRNVILLHLFGYVKSRYYIKTIYEDFELATDIKNLLNNMGY